MALVPSRGSAAVVSVALALLAAGALLALAACESPSRPTPAASPAPAPTPAPTPLPAHMQGCGLPAGSGAGLDCPRESESFLAEVETALDRLEQQRPALFDFGDVLGPSGYLVDERPLGPVQDPAVLEPRAAGPEGIPGDLPAGLVLRRSKQGGAHEVP